MIEVFSTENTLAKRLFIFVNMISCLVMFFALNQMASGDELGKEPKVIVYGSYNMATRDEKIHVLKNDGVDEKQVLNLASKKKFIEKIKNPEAHTEYIFLMSYNVPAEGFRSTRLWVRNGNVKYQGQIIKLDKLLAQLGVIKTYGELMRECENSSSSNERLPSNKLSDHARDDAR